MSRFTSTNIHTNTLKSLCLDDQVMHLLHPHIFSVLLMDFIIHNIKHIIYIYVVFPHSNLGTDTFVESIYVIRTLHFTFGYRYRTLNTQTWTPRLGHLF